jgi:hypothetical protein
VEQSPYYHHDINPEVLNLAFRVMHDEEFKASIQVEVARVAIQEAMATNAEQKRKARAEFNKRVWVKCGRNAALLMPWFFPRYPRREPFDLRNRPFNMILMFMFVYATVVLRGSRQHGKSTTMATDARLCAELFANLKQLYVAPHSEPLTTFSRKYLEVEKAFRYPVVGAKWKQNQYYKQYPNGGELDMQRVMTSATSVRGKSADILRIDECVASYTQVVSGEKLKKVVELSVGDPILSFDENNQISEDRVRSIVCKGGRHVWRLELSSGRALVCSSNEKIKTSRGWHYLADFPTFPGVESGGSSNADRDSPRGRLHPNPQGVQISEVSGCARTTSEKLLPSENGFAASASDDGRGTDKGGGEGERRLRGLYSAIPHARESNADAVSQALSHPRCYPPRQVEENSNAGVGESVDLGVGGLVVHGRRLQTEQIRHVQHAVVLEGGSGSARRVVYEEGIGSRSQADQEGQGQDILDPADQYCLLREASEKSSPLHSSGDALQDRGLGDADTNLHVRVLREGVSGERSHEQDETFLQETDLSRAEHSRDQAQASGNDRSEREVSEYEGNSVLDPGKEKTSSAAGLGAATAALPGSRVSGGSQRVEEKVSCAAQAGGAPRETGDGTDMSVLPNTFQKYGDSQSVPQLADHILRRASMSGEETETFTTGQTGATEHQKEEPLRVLTVDGWEEIVDVSYHGFEEVWDIETEKHHTFFADGIGVHNCQLFDPGLEMEVLEVLNDSKMKIYQMAGTATTLESLLETRFQEGCQAVWHIRHPNGKKIINCGDPEDVIPYIGPYQMEDPVTKEKIDPLNGSYEFLNPQGFADRIVSIHVPQIINPDKLKPIEWNGIYKAFQRDRRKATKEKLGVPLEEGNREVTKNDMKRICVLPEGPDERLLKCQKGYYKCLVSAFDWGGSDYNTDMKTKISTTCHVIMGLSPENKVHLLYGKRHGGADYPRILNEIALAHNRHRAGAMASDFGGGALYNTKLREHPYINARRHIIFDYDDPEAPYCAPARKSQLANMMMLNKTDSLTSLFMAIVAAEPLILAPSWDEFGDFLEDFTNNHRVMTEASRAKGGRRFVYHRHGSRPDDFLHAVNFGFQLIKLHYNQALIVDPAGREMIRSAVGGDGGSVQSGWAAALSSYSRSDKEFD